MSICLYNFWVFWGFFFHQQGRRLQPAHQVYIWGGEILRQKLCSKSWGQQRGTETKPVGRGTWKHPCHYQFICTWRSVIYWYNTHFIFSELWIQQSCRIYLHKLSWTLDNYVFFRFEIDDTCICTGMCFWCLSED